MSFLFSPVCCCGSKCFICYDRFDRPPATGSGISTGPCIGYDFIGNADIWTITNSGHLYYNASGISGVGQQWIIPHQNINDGIAGALVLRGVSGVNNTNLPDDTHIKLYLDYATTGSNYYYADFWFTEISGVQISLYHHLTGVNNLLSESALFPWKWQGFSATPANHMWIGAFNLYTNTNVGPAISTANINDGITTLPCTGITGFNNCFYPGGTILVAGMGEYPFRRYEITATEFPSVLPPDPGINGSRTEFVDYRWNSQGQLGASIGALITAISGNGGSAFSVESSGTVIVSGLGLYNNSNTSDSVFANDYISPSSGSSTYTVSPTPLCVTLRETCDTIYDTTVGKSVLKFLDYNIKTSSGSFDVEYINNDFRLSSMSDGSICEYTTKNLWQTPDTHYSLSVSGLFKSGVYKECRIDLGYNDSNIDYPYYVYKMYGNDIQRISAINNVRIGLELYSANNGLLNSGSMLISTGNVSNFSARACFSEGLANFSFSHNGIITAFHPFFPTVSSYLPNFSSVSLPYSTRVHADSGVRLHTHNLKYLKKNPTVTNAFPTGLTYSVQNTYQNNCGFCIGSCNCGQPIQTLYVNIGPTTTGFNPPYSSVNIVGGCTENASNSTTRKATTPNCNIEGEYALGRLDGEWKASGYNIMTFCGGGIPCTGTTTMNVFSGSFYKYSCLFYHNDNDGIVRATGFFGAGPNDYAVLNGQVFSIKASFGSAMGQQIEDLPTSDVGFGFSDVNYNFDMTQTPFSFRDTSNNKVVVVQIGVCASCPFDSAGFNGIPANTVNPAVYTGKFPTGVHSNCSDLLATGMILNLVPASTGNISCTPSGGSSVVNYSICAWPSSILIHS